MMCVLVEVSLNAISANDLHSRVIALAAACQSLAMLRDFARKGSTEDQQFTILLESIVNTDPQHINALYGDLSGLKRGFQIIVDQLSNKPHTKDNDLTRYLAGIMALERRLSKSPEGFNILANRISEIKRQQQHFALTDPQMLSNLASIYTDVISPLGAKIQVVGMPQQIQKRLIQDKIRTLLLATMRSVVLWRQLGGRRRHLIFQRKKILHSTQHYLATI